MNSLITQLSDQSQTFQTFSLRLSRHGKLIDSVWKSHSYAVALKENPINLFIF